MDVARLLDRKVALVDRAVARRPEAELLLERAAFEELRDAGLGLFVERRIDAGVLEDGEADLLQRTAELADEALAIARIRAAPETEVASSDAVLLVELLFVPFGQAILLVFVHTFVAREVLVDRVDVALPVVRGHAFVIASSVDACRTRRWLLRHATSRRRSHVAERQRP